METISVALICSFIGVFSTLWSINRNKTQDIKLDTKEEAIVATKLDYISRGVDDIKLDNKARDRQMHDLAKDIIEVKQSVKSAHHRIDSIEIINKKVGI
ncbi:hypothetical protein HYH39_02385 [Clostridium botulinum]|nr:hypothetical protein KU40_06860 [Clostridium botulinum]MBY6778037.1 hypothetical protein [Clostridium botulinum]MBY6850975.1 hypothetical protein [Clostridium botulinum]NFF25042.1 hypothetical protein [Clostridium botulinum]NFF37642.1 hypothetical protein [Clostridium botulinum]